MREAPETFTVAEIPQSSLDLQLLVVPVSPAHNFLENVRELLSSSKHVAQKGDASDFWTDVFVDCSLPWGRFLQSGAFHTAAILMIWAGSRFVALHPSAIVKPALTQADVVYYTPSEYLPAVDTRRANTPPARRRDPQYSVQPIISLPAEAENHSQRIVAPPKLRLHRDAALPNVIAWSEKPEIPIAPAPVVLASEKSRLAPKIAEPVIAPPPQVADRTPLSKRDTPHAPQLAVIAPPPQVDPEGARRFGDLEIARAAIIAPAPQLSLDEQQSARSAAAVSAQSMQVIAPPPVLGTYGGARSGGNMIALSLHPAVTPPNEAVIGNRLGTFATTSAGHRAATGAAGGNSGTTGKGDASASAKHSGDLPSGLYVGKAASSPSMASGDRSATSSKLYDVNPNLLADARPPRVTAHTLQPGSTSTLSEEERAVFGNRKLYSLSLNMPNLNSAGGSWVIRFAALGGAQADESRGRAAASPHAAPASKTDLSAPSPTRKVDPAYPLELMRQNVGGTVILYAIIRSDGSVGNVRVLRSVDERLDRYASQAIAKWQFDPAREDGSPVDVEATFWIPFRPVKTSSEF
jgi:TonB family protein